MSDSYEETVQALADATGEQVARVVEQWQAGDLTEPVAAALIAAVIARAHAKATALADLGMAATLTVRTQTAVPALGLAVPSGEPERLRRAGSTLLRRLDPTGDTHHRAHRLGHSETLTRAAAARSDAIAASPLVSGWVRNLNGDGCQLCTFWWRGGRVWPADHRMPTHKGCNCTQTPVLAESVRQVQR